MALDRSASAQPLPCTFTTTPQLAIAGVGQFLTGNKLHTGILLAALLLMLSFASKARKMARVADMLTVLFGVFLMTIGCGSNQKKLVTNTNGTPSGTYTYALTATAGTVSHTQTVTLVVK